jgi:uncharacterized protein with HEPN domain
LRRGFSVFAEGLVGEAKALKMGFEGKGAEAQAELGDDLWELHSAAGKIAEFTAGRTLEDYGDLEVLRATVESMLQVMETAAARIARRSAEIAARLAGLAALKLLMEVPQRTDIDVWRFIEKSLPELVSSVGDELETWHSG